MLESRAVGGPRHHVKISAPAHWDGRVGSHPGRYVWRWGQWVWEDAANAPPAPPKFREQRSDKGSRRGSRGA